MLSLFEKFFGLGNKRKGVERAIWIIISIVISLIIVVIIVYAVKHTTHNYSNAVNSKETSLNNTLKGILPHLSSFYLLYSFLFAALLCYSFLHLNFLFPIGYFKCSKRKGISSWGIRKILVIMLLVLVAFVMVGLLLASFNVFIKHKYNPINTYDVQIKIKCQGLCRDIVDEHPEVDGAKCREVCYHHNGQVSLSMIEKDESIKRSSDNTQNNKNKQQ